MSNPEPLSEPEHDVAAAAEAAAVFRREDGQWLPSQLAQGPWNPSHLHGGPICGALAHAVEACAAPVPMRVARMTVEMTRAVPMEAFSLRAEVVRAGRRVQQIEARIECAGAVLARATALRLREAAPDPALAVASEQPVPERAPGAPARAFAGAPFVPGFIRAVDFLRTRTPERGEDGITWARLRVPLVEGEAPSPFVRLATLADFASGTGNPLDFTRVTSINPDLSLHVLRPPRGEWIGMRARSAVAPDGVGQSHAILFDDEGEVARALVSLLVERR